MNDLHSLIFPSPEGLEVEELAAEHIELRNDDPRLATLPMSTRLYVIGHYGGDINEAIRRAQHEVHTNLNPPKWATDLVGPRKGWIDPINLRVV